jgi:hypothetical protein
MTDIDSPIVDLPVALVETLEARIEEMVATHGKVAPSQIVEAARDENSPLHQVFEWDDTIAAQEHRLLQARQLIRTVVVRPHAYRPSDKFSIVGTGREIQITRKVAVLVSRPAEELPPSPPPTKIVTGALYGKFAATEKPAAVEPKGVAGLASTLQNVATYGEASQRILAEVAILTEVKSRLVAIPEAIDVARELRELIVDITALAGRIGKLCNRCHMRNHTLGDGKHQCTTLNLSSGSSNLGEANSR